MKRIAALLALVCAQAFAYVGSFEPAPIRNVATVTFIDSQLAGATCAIEAAKAQPAYALLSPTQKANSRMRPALHRAVQIRLIRGSICLR